MTRGVSEAREAAIRSGYAAGKRPKEIAAELGSTAGSIKATACRLGVTHRGHARFDFRRGFAVPPEKQVDYQLLVHSKGFLASEAAAMLGLLPTPPCVSQTIQEGELA